NDNNGGGVVSGEPPALLPPTPIEAGPLPPTPRPARPPATGGGSTSAARTATALPRTAGPTSTTSPATVTPIVNTSDGVFFTLASDWGSAFPSQNVRYTIAARNGKTDLALREVVISIGLASNVELTGKPVSDRGDPEVSGNRVIMRLNELTTGQGIEIGIPVRIKSDVAVGTRIVAQAEMTYRGLSTPIYSNIVPILIVGQAQQATATALPSATATVATTATAPAATATATAAATATSTPLATTTPGAVATATRGTTGVQPSNPPGTVTQLPETSSGVPISGLALLGLTLLTRTFRLHRAQDRI
ncbi:MAG TPA: hypothetical protein VFT99_08755, partial [Roseiflexaceae bacterium]|nr:hypothetical protein [Roseiflexaceae bacterium]